MVRQLPHLDRTEVADFCRSYRIRRLALFGSVLRDDFRSDSDVDVLVEFDPGATPGFDFFDIQQRLATMVGRPVDLCTRNSLKERCRERILAQAQDIYVAS